jgi:hypothetical protein
MIDDWLLRRGAECVGCAVLVGVLACLVLMWSGMMETCLLRAED